MELGRAIRDGGKSDRGRRKAIKDTIDLTARSDDKASDGGQRRSARHVRGVGDPGLPVWIVELSPAAAG